MGSPDLVGTTCGGTQYIDDLVQIGTNDDPSDGSEQACETTYWGLQDANYNVLGTVESDGDLKERYEYTPYGQRTVYKSAGSDDALCMSPILESQRVVVSGIAQAYGICDVGHQGLFFDKEWGEWHNRTRPYHSVFARFPVRDLAGYGDGMNAYECVGSNPVSYADPSGLWKIHRNGQALAPALAERDDTVEKLADEIGLDAKEFKNWLTLTGGTVKTPTGNKELSQPDAKDVCCPGEKVSIPNVVLAYWGGELGDDGKRWVGWDKNVAALKKRGFAVTEWTKYTRALAAGDFAMASLFKQLHGIYYWGHGSYTGWYHVSGALWWEKKERRPGGLGWKVWDQDKTRPADWFRYDGHDYYYGIPYPRIQRALAYKMGFGLLFACYTQEAKDLWHLFHDGPNSVFKGSKGVLAPIVPGFEDDAVDKYLPPGKQGTVK